MINLQKRFPLLIIILLNLIPVYGMFFLKWSIFSVLYFYWLETLVTSIFNALKMAYAAKEITGSRTKMILQYLLFRVAMFFFYLIFIFVFVGMIIATKEQLGDNLKTILFLDKTFNWAVVGMILSYGFNLTFNYILNDEYKQFSPNDFNIIFDFRTGIMHIVIVLGAVIYGFMEEKGMTSEQGSYIYLVFFILLKTLYDIFTHFSDRNKYRKKFETAN